MPTIEDPSCPGTSFNHRWDEDQYTNFKAKIKQYAGWAREALDENDDSKAVMLWQKLFGTEFTLSIPVPTGKTAMKAPSRIIEAHAPREEFIEDRGFAFTGGYMARIDASVDKKPGFRNGRLRSIRTVGKDRTLRFRVVTDTPKPYEV